MPGHLSVSLHALLCSRAGRLFGLGVLVCGLVSFWLLARPGATPAQAATIIYVDDDAGGANTGASWTDAYTSLQSAMSVAAAGDEIWVATGVYTTGTFVTTTFVLTDGVALYGGFSGDPGTEGDFDVRDWQANPTVLSGDLFDDDIKTPTGVITQSKDIQGSNSLHVVTSSGVTRTAVLDGFTITAGKASGGLADPCRRVCGGGIYNVGGSPTLANLVFSGNRAANRGGGMYNAGDSNPSLTHVTFTGNASLRGGGMYNGNSSPTLSDVSFIDNQAAGSGGGMYNGSSSPSLSRVTFRGNDSIEGGGMFNSNSSPSLRDVRFSSNWAVTGGGMFSRARSSPSLSNVLLNGNYSGAGGALYNSNSTPTLTNVTLSGNQAAFQGGGIYNESNGQVLLQNSIIWGNQAASGRSIFASGTSTTTLRYSTVEGGIQLGSVDAGDNLFTDPLFVSAVLCGADGVCADDPSTPGDESADDDYGDLHLQPGSPAIDAGDNVADLDGTGLLTATIAGVPTDLAGDPRRLAVRSAAPTVDMGAYEAPNSPPEFASSPALTANVEVNYTYAISATDPNQPDGDGLVLSAPTLPGWLTFNDLGGGAGTLSGTPHSLGIQPVELRVQDGAGLTATQAFSLTVVTMGESGRLLLPLVDR